MRETWVRSLGWEDPLEKGKATHSSIQAGESHGLYSLQGRRESDTTERLSLTLLSLMKKKFHNLNFQLSYSPKVQNVLKCFLKKLQPLNTNLTALWLENISLVSNLLWGFINILPKCTVNLCKYSTGIWNKCESCVLGIKFYIDVLNQHC